MVKRQQVFESRVTETSPNAIHLSIKASGHNSPIKTKLFSDWLKKRNSSLCFTQETYLKQCDSERLKIKGICRKAYQKYTVQIKIK